MSNRAIHILFGAIIGGLLVFAATIFLQNSSVSMFGNENFPIFFAVQNDVSILVPSASEERDGVHFEGGMQEVMAWGPLTYTVEPDGSAWIDDTPAMRKIHVNLQGEVIEVNPYAYGQQPRETYSEDQALSAELVETRTRLTQEALYDAFTVSSSEVYYWGTSPEGFQYWKTTETRQDANGVLRVHTFLQILDVSGTTFAIAELPTSSQYTYVFNGGIFVDPERNIAYFMTTSPTGVRIHSVDWIQVQVNR